MDNIFENFSENFLDNLKNKCRKDLAEKNQILFTSLGISTLNFDKIKELMSKNLSKANQMEMNRFFDELNETDELGKKINEIFKKFNPKFNRIYLFENGKAHLDINEEPEIEKFMKTRFKFLIYSGHPYYCPEGWRRYSLEVKDFERFEDWPVAYHGTSSKNLISILAEGFRISNRNACFGDGIYFSPSIEYCGHWRYGKPKRSKTTNFYLQAVFQCRLRPDSFTKHRETMILDDKKERKSRDPDIDVKKVIDPKFDNKELEWIISSNKLEELKNQNLEAFIIYGLMIRVTKEHPKNLKINKWWDYYYDMPEDIKNL